MSFPIFKTIPVPIIHKCAHVRKIGGRLYYSFIKDYGEIPVVILEINKIIAVENTRGNAYAARKRLKYRKTKKQLLADKKYD